jgi:hypothetical protein
MSNILEKLKTDEMRQAVAEALTYHGLTPELVKQNYGEKAWKDYLPEAQSVLNAIITKLGGE